MLFRKGKRHGKLVSYIRNRNLEIMRNKFCIIPCNTDLDPLSLGKNPTKLPHFSESEIELKELCVPQHI